MIDIERYTWTDEALAENEELLAQLIQTSADGLLMVAPDGRLTYLNPAAARLLGIPDGRAGDPADLERVFTLMTPDGHPLALHEHPAMRAIRTGEAVHGVEALVQLPAGERSVLSITAISLSGPAGETTGAVVSFQNVTERREAEEALKQHVTVLRAQAELLELAHDAIFVRDLPAGAIVYWNRGAEELYGFRRDEAVGRVSHELLHTRFPRPRREIEEAMVREGRWDGELVQRTREGREVTVESRWALQRDSRGEPVAFLEINRDISARKEAEAELARRLAELARRNKEVAAVNASMAAIAQTLDLAEVLQRIVDAARELVGARYAALGVADGWGRITRFITAGITPEQRAAIGPLPQGHGLLGALINEGRPLRVRHIARDPRGHGFPPHHPPMTSLLGVPILSRGRAVGDLYLTDKLDADEFGEADQELLTLFASHAAMAIENAQLYEDVRAARDQLRAWNRDLEAAVTERTREIERMSRETTTRVLQAQEEERGRIARELHDETAQSLATLLITLDLLRPHVPDGGPLGSGLRRFEDVLKRTLDEVRALSHDLRPPILDDFGLVAAIESFAADWTQTFGVPVRVQVALPPGEQLPPDVEVALFRVAQEAMTNVGKYARARAVDVSLSAVDGDVLLMIRDDGAGFDPEQARNQTRQGGLGLYGMRERAALLGGSLTIDTAPGRGTRVTLRAPIR
ncbi:MAG: PAS domain S-box protein [Chloroflexi bacterium]|nr:PAS domain S-box protein [Chloroflexota bacterium]